MSGFRLVLLTIVVLTAALSCRKTNVETVHKGEPYYTLSYTLRYNAGGIIEYCDTSFGHKDSFGDCPRFDYEGALDDSFKHLLFYSDGNLKRPFYFRLLLGSEDSVFVEDSVYTSKDIVAPGGIFYAGGFRVKKVNKYSFRFEIDRHEDTWQDYYLHFEGIGLGINLDEEGGGIGLDTVRICNGLFSVGRNLLIEKKHKWFKYYNYIKNPDNDDKNINYHRE